VKYLDGEAMGRQVFLASRRFFERLARTQPLVLVFEDLHWVDESSALLLEHLLPLVERVPLLICCVSRPYRQSPAARLQEVAGRDLPACYTEIQLAPLSQADSAQLVRNLLAIESLPSRVREMILRKAEGNPFFLEEIIRALIDAGGVVHAPTTGRWQATAQIESITIPDTIQGVIMARVDRLEEDVKQALRTAAVVGRSFLYRVLRAVEEADRQLDQHLAELQEIQFIREKQRVPELEYIFKHALVQEATYESILLQKRRVLHAQVGQAIEVLFADRLEEFYGLLAYHYARAEAWEKAQAYLLKAGDQAGRVAADAEALAHYEQALEAYARAFGDRWDPLQRAQLERKMGEALFRRGEHAQALEYLLRALAYLGRPLPTSRWGVRLAIVQEIIQQIAHRLLPRLFLKPMGGPVSPAVEEEHRTYELIGWIEAWADQERLLLAALNLMNVAERAGFPAGIVVGATGLALAGDLIPLFWLAEGYHRRAVALAEQIDDPSALSLAYQSLGIHELYLGHLEAVVEHSQHAATLYQGLGDLHRWGTATVQLTYALHDQGDLSQALTLCRDAVLLGREGDDPHVVCLGLQVQGAILQRMGRLDEAMEVLGDCIELAEATSTHSSRIAAGGALGLCYLCQGELQQALCALHATQQAYVKYGATGGTATALRIGLAEAYLVAAKKSDGLQQSEKADWLTKAKNACRDALKLGKLYAPMMPAAMRLRGTYEWLRGKRATAQKWWHRSLALAEQMGERYYLGKTHLEMGRRLGERAHLERAEAIFSEIGAQWDLARAREALEERQIP
jgi:tetratricopeptide (TPR) repeat protein